MAQRGKMQGATKGAQKQAYPKGNADPDVGLGAFKRGGKVDKMPPKGAKKMPPKGGKK